jgi:hypothetical protein
VPAVGAVVRLGVGVIAGASAALRCEDAARLGARSVARGDPAGTSVLLARAEAPDGATVVLGAPSSNGLVRVAVRVRVRMPGPLGGVLPSWSVSGAADALAERS